MVEILQFPSMASVFSPRPIPSHFGSRTALCSKARSPQIRIRQRLAKPRRSSFLVAAEGGNGLRQDEDKNKNNNGGGVDQKRDRQRSATFNFRWRDLLSPDPDNAVAVALTGLLTWASVQVLFQIFFISVAILLAALKYSFIAALLLFILIALL